jgi:hypothetical protein
MGFCTLTQFKQFRNGGILDTNTDRDSYYQDLIDRATSWLQTALGRDFTATDYYEWTESVSGMVVPRQFPPISVYGLRAAGETALSVQFTDATATGSTISIGADSAILKSWSSTGAETSTTKLFATYQSTDALVTQINSVSNWTATVNQNVRSKWLVNATYNTLNSQALIAAATDFLPYEIKGNSIRTSANGQVLLHYRAGFETLPQGIVQLGIMAALHFDQKYGDTKTRPSIEYLNKLMDSFRKVII